MGLLSFFKRSDKTRKPDPLKAQPYGAASPASPPVKGTIPLAGNGPQTLETLQEKYVDRKGSSPSLALEHEMSAPPPTVPRFRDDNQPRPSTAPHSRSNSMSRPVSRSRREPMFNPGAPPVSLRKVRVNSTAVTPKQTTNYPPSHPLGLEHNRATSITSIGTSSSRRCVDLLDAQSELRPTNFRTRVKAAGIRDYGEDVAERNIGINGFNLASAQVQAFYATVGHTAPAPVVARTSFHEATLLRPKPRRPLSRSSSYRRAVSLQALPPDPQPTQEESLMPSLPINSAAGQRHSYVPPMPSEQSAGERRSESIYIPDTSLKHMAMLETLPTQLRPSTSLGAVPDRSEHFIHDFPRSKPFGAPHEYVVQSGARSRRRTTISIAVVDSAARELFPQDELSIPGRSRPSASKSATTLNKHLLQPVVKAPKKYHSLASIQTSFVRPPLNAFLQDSRLSPRLADPSVQPPFSTAWNHTDFVDADEQGPIPLSHSLEEVFDEAASPPPAIPVHPSHSRNPSGQSFPRSKGSVPSVLASPRLGEIPEQISARGSSRRQRSISSATSPTTTASSSASMRPQSRHTANTSVDLPLGQHQHAPTGDCIPTISPNMIQPETPKSACASINGPESPSAAPSRFNIDDYISSDDDGDDDTPRRSSYEGEQELLFKDAGYGSMQLPGLFDSISPLVGTSTGNTVATNASGHSEPGDAQSDCSLGPAETRGKSLLTLALPTLAPSPLQRRRGGAALSLRHTHNAPDVPGAYSFSKYRSDEERPRSQRQSAAVQRKRSRDQFRNHRRSRIDSRDPKQAAMAPDYAKVLQDLMTDAESESEYDEEGCEMGKLQERTSVHQAAQCAGLAVPRHPSPEYIPRALHRHHGPVLQLPLMVNVQTPKKSQLKQKNPLMSRPPTLLGHQKGEPNPREKEYQPPSSIHRQSDSEDESVPADIPRNRRRSSNATNSPPNWPGYTYGHGGAAYGHGYGFVRLLPEDRGGKNSRNESFPGTPVEEDGFFGGKGKKSLVAAGAFGRSDSRGSISSERAKEAIRKLRSRHGDE